MWDSFRRGRAWNRRFCTSTSPKPSGCRGAIIELRLRLAPLCLALLLLGPDAPALAAANGGWDALMTKGAAAVEQSRLAEAEKDFRKALEQTGKGPAGKLRRATTLNNLGYVLHRMGRLAGAEELYAQALALRQEQLGPEHPDVAQSLSNLAEVKRARGRLEEAERLYRRALAIREKVFGPDHPDLAQPLSGLAVLYAESGRGEEARKLLLRVLRILSAARGEKDPRTLEARSNLASLEYSLGRFSEAEALYRAVLAAQKATLGEDAPETVATLVNLAEVLRSLGKSEEAVGLLEKALELRRARQGPEHPETARVLNDLGVNLHALGREEEAREKLEQAVAAYEAADASLEQRLPAYLNLAAVLGSLGEQEEAKKVLEKAAALSEAGGMRASGELARLWNDLGVVEYALGDYRTSREKLQRAVQVAEAAWGSKDPRLVPYLRNYATVLSALARDKEARDVTRRIEELGGGS